MKHAGQGFGGHSSIDRGYHPENDWEVAEEISPDPFSEELHTPIHARRHRSSSQSKSINNRETNQKQEISEDNPM